MTTAATTTTTAKNSETKVFVGNLAFRTTEQELGEAFKPFGTVYVHLFMLCFIHFFPSMFYSFVSPSLDWSDVNSSQANVEPFHHRLWIS
jgi:ABC-type Fe3+ transport system permease subunit